MGSIYDFPLLTHSNYFAFNKKCTQNTLICLLCNSYYMIFLLQIKMKPQFVLKSQEIYLVVKYNI